MRGFERALRRGVAAAAVIGAGAGCVRAGAPEEPPVCVTVPFEPPEPPAPRRPRPLAPLEAPGPLVDLPVPGFLDAVVSLPLGATTPRPLVVAAHGAGDRPESQCRYWRDVVGNAAFVVCPRGYPESATGERAGFFYPSYPALGAEIEGAMAALLGRYHGYADPREPVFAGFAQGAALGALLLPHHPARFARAVLIEGGTGAYREWSRPSARRFHERGGRRVLFACGCAECATTAAASELPLSRERLTVQIVHVPGAGETYLGDVGAEVARAFPWLVAGDDRFGALAE